MAQVQITYWRIIHCDSPGCAGIKATELLAHFIH